MGNLWGRNRYQPATTLMTTDFTDSGTTTGDFETTLENLFVAADKNDISVEGGWSP